MSTLAIIILLASVTTIIVVIAVVYMKPKHVVKKVYPQMGDTGGTGGISGGTGGISGGMNGGTGGISGDKVVEPQLININTSIYTNTNTKPFYIQSADTKYFLNVTNTGTTSMVANISEATPFTNNKQQIIFPSFVTPPRPNWAMVFTTDVDGGWYDPRLLYIKSIQNSFTFAVRMNKALGESHGIVISDQPYKSEFFTPLYLVNLIIIK
jgi:hypothetical protein